MMKTRPNRQFTTAATLSILLLFPLTHSGSAEDAVGLDFDDLMNESEFESIRSEPSTPRTQSRSSSQGESPDPVSTAIGFDDLWEEKPGSNKNAEVVTFEARDESNEAGVYAPQLTMDDIHSSRSEIKVDNAIGALKTKVDRIFERCECLVSKKTCFDRPSFSISDVNKSLRGIEDKFNQQQDQVCYSWQNVFKNLTRDIDHINATTINADSSLDYIAKLSTQFEDVVQKHRSENRRIERAKQAAANDSGGGFQWGKLAALGVGAAIGGIGNLDSATQLELAAGMVADSMEGVEGTSNFQGSANSALSRLAPPPAPSGRSGGGSGRNSAGRPAEPKTLNHPVTCPGSSNTTNVPIPWYTINCREAAKHFAEVFACNRTSEMAAAEKRCEESCIGIDRKGNKQCLEGPPAGTTTGSGDADMDFLNSF